MSAILKQTAGFLFLGLNCPPPKSGAKGGGGQTEQEGPEEQDMKNQMRNMGQEVNGNAIQSATVC